MALNPIIGLNPAALLHVSACEELLSLRPLPSGPPLGTIPPISPTTPNAPPLPPLTNNHPLPVLCSVYSTAQQQLDALLEHYLFTPQTQISPSVHPLRQPEHHLSIMRALLESSWMRFGPAGRGSYDWVTGSPSTQEKQGRSWNELNLGEDKRSELVVYVILGVISVLLLALLVCLIYRRCSRSKLSLADIIALDLQDAESSAEFLSSLTRNAERHTSTSSDGSDGVFVMVYLPPPYEETLTKITRAASLSSSKDVESIKIEDLEAKLCPELKSSGQYV